MFDLSFYAIALLAHVVAGTVLVGSTMFAPLVHRSILAADSFATLRMWLDLDRRASRANPPIAMVLLATGIYLGSAGFWSMAWFYVAVAAWVLNCALAIAVVDRTAAAVRAAAGTREGAIDAKVDALRRSRTWGLAHEIMGGSDLAMLYVMFVKPGLAESIVVTVGAMLLFVAVGQVRGRAAIGQAARVAS
jgi:hypothetical protein